METQTNEQIAENLNRHGEIITSLRDILNDGVTDTVELRNLFMEKGITQEDIPTNIVLQTVLDLWKHQNGGVGTTPQEMYSEIMADAKLSTKDQLLHARIKDIENEMNVDVTPIDPIKIAEVLRLDPTLIETDMIKDAIEKYLDQETDSIENENQKAMKRKSLEHKLYVKARLHSEADNVLNQADKLASTRVEFTPARHEHDPVKEKFEAQSQEIQEEIQEFKEEMTEEIDDLGKIKILQTEISEIFSKKRT